MVYWSMGETDGVLTNGVGVRLTEEEVQVETSRPGENTIK